MFKAIKGGPISSATVIDHGGLIVAHVQPVWGDENKHNERATLFAAAPKLLEAARKGAQAIKDIIGAAENDEPYTLEELINSFLSDYSEIEAVISKATGEV